MRRPLLAALLLSACSAREPLRPEPPINKAQIATPPPPTSSPNEPTPEPPSEPETPPPPPPLPQILDDMALVPAGPFLMGADHRGEKDEHPAHTVTLPAFYLDLTEVTNEAYQKCIDKGPCPKPDPKNAERNGIGPDTRFRGPRQPVSSVSWHSARAYCQWIGKRLPTEAEFEKAARGADGRRYPWGNETPTPEHAVFHTDITADVGTHPAGDGPYGHHDLAGNVWEWVEDIYDPYAYKRPDAQNGKGGDCKAALAAFDELRRRKQDGYTGYNPIPHECERVLRGGAFNYHASGLRVTNRVHHPPRYCLVMSGFRCARDAPAVVDSPSP